MRPLGWAKSGYYPTPQTTLANLAANLNTNCAFYDVPHDETPQVQILDPCCGEGHALAQIATALERNLNTTCGTHREHQVTTWGIEVNADRAREARRNLDHVIQEDFDNVLLPTNAFHLLWLNPPYDWDREESAGTRRLESHFLQMCTPALTRGGRLFYLVPQHVAREDAAFLSRNYQINTGLYRLPDPDYEQFKQVVIWGNREPHSPYEQYESKLQQLTRLARDGADAQPLPEQVSHHQIHTMRLAPTGNQTPEPHLDTLRHSRQELIDAARQEGMWHDPDLKAVLDPKLTRIRMRPMEPLRGGQIALMIADGQLDNIPIPDRSTGQPFCIKGDVFKETHTLTDDENKTVTEERFHSRVSTMNLITGEVTQIGRSQTDASLAEFVTDNFDALAEHTKSQFPARFDPTDDNAQPIREKLLTLPRTPIGKQAPSIISAAMNLRDNPVTIGLGQPGTGKTYMAIAITTSAGFSRILVQAPSHAITTWIQEIRETTPKAQIFVPDAVRAPAPTNVSDPHFMQVETLSAGDDRRYGVPSHRNRKKNDKLAIDLETLAALPATTEQPVWVLMSKERSKLHYPTAPLIRRSSLLRWEGQLQVLRVTREDEDGTHFREKLEVDTCVHCWHPLDVDKKTGEIIAQARNARNKKARCPNCDEPINGPNPNGLNGRRIALGEYIARRMAGEFDLYVVDEVHQYKADNSGQGVTTGRLAQRSRRTLALTGTITGGKAEDLFYLLQRFKPGFQKHFGWDEELRFVRRYGRIETTTYKESGNSRDSEEVGAFTQRRTKGSRIRTLPGIHPHVQNFLLDSMFVIRLNDIDRSLNEAEIVPRILALDDEPQPWPGMPGVPFSQKKGYEQLQRVLQARVKDNPFDMKLLSTMIQLLLTWPENGWDQDCLQDRETGETLLAMPTLDPERLYPKERELIDIIKMERAQGRKVLVYCTHTNRRDTTRRVRELLGQHGITAITMAQNIPPRNRLDWLERNAQLADAIITNPQLVETGLNLLQFPSIVWYETHFSTYVTQQASSRSLRLNQREKVRVYHLAYADTFQERALKLVATKADASDVLYGELAGGNLSALNVDSTNIISALAKDIYQLTRQHDSRSIDQRTQEILDAIQANRQAASLNSTVLTNNAQDYIDLITELQGDATEASGAAPLVNIQSFASNRPAPILTGSDDSARQLVMNLFGD